MKKMLAILCLAAVSAYVGYADTYTYTTTVTNGQAIAYSDPLPISGWLDRIEAYTEINSTTTVTVASYAGTTAAFTYFSAAIGQGASLLPTNARTRVVGTTSAGADLSSSVTDSGIGATGLVTQVKSVPFERPMIGGNVKCAVTGTANDGSCPVTVTIFFEPLNK